ncbi:unnamed protein product [Clonostachys rosea f. rosea IK726]|uniref:Uncharacterized protein n=2 Tax=Bionectria ochroleuca TaxID=29856 RepID=A0A0B7K1V1_BIOOC|nr:unnamed protein product [Clonostachys rosea f. rosea IK726]
MATGHIGGYLAQQPSDLTGVEDRGLRFINEDWNGSISNGIPFTLKWNETIDDEDGELKLYNVSYPQGGGVSFELVSNLTGSLANMSYVWTPKGLNGSDLYAFWVTRQRAHDAEWAVSPPWKISDEPRGFHWSTPVGVPIVVILGVYFACLISYLVYRRRRKIKRERDRDGSEEQAEAQDTPDAENADRHPSVSSVATVQTFTQDDSIAKNDSPIALAESPISYRSRSCSCSNRGHAPTLQLWTDRETDDSIGQAR